MKTKLQQPLTRSMFWISTFLFLGAFIITLSVYVHDAYAATYWVYKYAKIADVDTHNNVTYTLNNFHEWRIRKTAGGSYNKTGRMKGGFHRAGNIGEPGRTYDEDITLNGSIGIYDFYADYDFNASVGTYLTDGRDYYCSVYTNLLDENYDNPGADPHPDAQAKINRSDDTFTAGEYPIFGSEDDRVIADSQEAHVGSSATATRNVTP